MKRNGLHAVDGSYCWQNYNGCLWGWHKRLETQFKSSSILVSILHRSFNNILMKITVIIFKMTFILLLIWYLIWNYEVSKSLLLNFSCFSPYKYGYYFKLFTIAILWLHPKWLQQTLTKLMKVFWSLWKLVKLSWSWSALHVLQMDCMQACVPLENHAIHSVSTPWGSGWWTLVNRVQYYTRFSHQVHLVIWIDW